MNDQCSCVCMLSTPPFVVVVRARNSLEAQVDKEVTNQKIR